MKCILTLLCLPFAWTQFFYANAQNKQYPFTGVAISLPGKVEAENYDLGGQGIAYNDADILNLGYSYRSEGVDIEPCSEGGYNVGYIAAGEWLKYTINVTATANYRIDLRTASIQSGGVIQLELDGNAITKEISLPNTSGWQNWSTTTLPSVPLLAGQYILRVFVVTGGFNINYLDFNANVVINKLPVVSISAPSNGTTFTAPASFSINANATDPDGTIAKVEFYNGTALIGTSTVAPYSYSWSNVPIGTYSITAKATDNLGGATVSPAATLVVIALIISNQPPNVVLTSPLNNTTNNAPSNIVLNADATDSDGTINRVEFYNGSILLWSDYSAPYSYIWNSVTAGSYSITAKAFDNQGASKVSSVATLTLVSVLSDVCSSITNYVENGGYVAGSKVKNGGSLYECKSWPYSSWCNGVAWAYAPGSGIYWSDAWILSGSCDNTRSSKESVTENTIDVLAVLPNPFQGATIVSLVVEESGELSLKLYDKTGQFVKTIVEGYLSSGSYSFPLNIEGGKSGFYLVKYITQRGYVLSKMIKAE